MKILSIILKNKISNQSFKLRKQLLLIILVTCILVHIQKNLFFLNGCKNNIDITNPDCLVSNFQIIISPMNLHKRFIEMNNAESYTLDSFIFIC